jgi:hypothetical protein
MRTGPAWMPKVYRSAAQVQGIFFTAAALPALPTRCPARRNLAPPCPGSSFRILGTMVTNSPDGWTQAS